MKIEQPFNINYGVKVKLTDAGVRHFIDFYKNAPYHQVRAPRIDEEGYTKFSMWMLMKIYGSHMNIGSWELPFETNVFVEIEQQQSQTTRIVLDTERSSWEFGTRESCLELIRKRSEKIIEDAISFDGFVHDDPGRSIYLLKIEKEFCWQETNELGKARVMDFKEVESEHL
ncbi:hypothetical protein EP56_05635 [Listeriaceae bacterium FSL A5-0209]|nr:hypothetical protein EP56_05635 [Listeriaceae bacterium FSL A5-0209]